MGEAKRGEETNEAGWANRGASGGFPGGSEDIELPESASEKTKSTFREYAETLVIAIILALFIRTFVVQAFKIPSGSMIPTLNIGDHILVSKFTYGVRLPFIWTTVIPLGLPKRGDVIVFRFPEDESKDFIKRVVGIPGDTIVIKDGVLYVNEIAQKEDYINREDNEPAPNRAQIRGGFGPITVPEASYFVMGDNRNHSLDSRFWGFVENSKIKGRAFLIYWSWDAEQTDWMDKIRFNRIGKIIR